MSEPIDHPAKGLRHWTRERPANPLCEGVHFLTITILGADGLQEYDPNGVTLAGLQGQIAAMRPLEEHPSILSGRPGVLIRTSEDQFALTPDEAQRFFLLALTPGEFDRFCDVVGATFELHDDFYDPDTGEALQPKTAVPGRDGDITRVP